MKSFVCACAHVGSEFKSLIAVRTSFSLLSDGGSSSSNFHMSIAINGVNLATYGLHTVQGGEWHIFLWFNVVVVDGNRSPVGSVMSEVLIRGFEGMWTSYT